MWLLRSLEGGRKLICCGAAGQLWICQRDFQVGASDHKLFGSRAPRALTVGNLRVPGISQSQEGAHPLRAGTGSSGASLGTHISPEAASAMEPPLAHRGHPSLGAPGRRLLRGVTGSDAGDLGSTWKLLLLCVQTSGPADSRGLTRARNPAT